MNLHPGRREVDKAVKQLVRAVKAAKRPQTKVPRSCSAEATIPALKR